MIQFSAFIIPIRVEFATVDDGDHADKGSSPQRWGTRSKTGVEGILMKAIRDHNDGGLLQINRIDICIVEWLAYF